MISLFQRSPDHYIPYVGHYPGMPEVAFNRDGTVFAMIRMDGSRYELEGPDDRNARHAVVNSLWRHISDDNVAVYSHLVRHRVRPPRAGEGQWRSSFARDLSERFAALVQTDLRANTWLLTLMVKPISVASRTPFKKADRSHPVSAVRPQQLRQLEDMVRAVMSTMRDYTPVRLGVKSAPTDMPGRPIMRSEIASALYLIRTGVEADLPVCSGPMSGTVYSNRVIVGPRYFDLNIPGAPRFGSIVSFRVYPHDARPGCLNKLLSAPYDLVLSQSYNFMLAQTSEFKSSLKARQMENVGDRAKTLQAQLDQSMDKIAAGEVVSGIHHLSVAVYSDATSRRSRDVEDALAWLDTSTSDVMMRLTDYGGAIAMQEGRLGAENAYYAQLPGVFSWRTRPGELNSDAFAAMSSFENFPTGKTHGHWGSAPIRFRTQGGTAFDFVTHVGEVGHTMLTGGTGAGKTALATALLAHLEPAMGDKGIRLIIDKDLGCRPLVELSGGRYLSLRRGRDSGLAPLRGLPNTPEARSFLLNLFRGLILRDGNGPVQPDEERRLALGIETQMGMPAALRSMDGVREFMGYDRNGAGDRFEKWCRGGEMGWMLDNDEHLVDFHAPVEARLYGFDFTELMPKEEGLADDGACAAAAAVIIYQMREMMDGRRIVAFFDECRFYMDTLGQVIEDLSLTGRKNELAVWMAAQEPSHFLSHRVGASLVGQCHTKIAFPNSKAVIDDYVSGLGFTRAAAEQIKTGMVVGGGHCFLVWRDEGAAICEFDLSSMPEELAILSGRKSTIGLLDSINREVSTLAERYREFRRRHHEIRSH